MKLRLFIAATIFSVLSVVTLSQITAANAQPAPITSPITSFKSTIRGQIKYRFLKQFPRINSFYVIPARNVVVKAEIEDARGISLGLISTKTDKNGNYTLETKDKFVLGGDTFHAFDVKQTRFLFNSPKAEVINFHGNIRYRLSLPGFNATKGFVASQPKYSVEYDADNNGEINNVDFRLLKPILSK